jgi:CRP-like cAMP-binding protein
MTNIGGRITPGLLEQLGLLGRIGQIYVLLEGEMDIRLGDYVVETAKEGALIGEMALIDDSPRAANAVAKSACRLAQIDQRRFDFLVQQHPHFARHVMKELADRLRHMNAAALR